MKSFLMTLKTMTVVALSFLLAVPSGNVVFAEEEAEAPETVAEETAEEVSESETAEPEEETVVEETEEPSEEVVEETEEPAEEVVAEEPAEPAEEVVEETEEPSEEVVAEEPAEPEEEAVEEETAKPEEAASEEEKPSESAETENVKTPDAEINGTIADNAVEITPDVETNVTISTDGQYKYFKFKPSQAGAYAFKSNSSDHLDTYGYLYDSTEGQIGSNDDGAGNLQFLLLCSLDANTQYYFGTRLLTSNTTGSYTVILQKLDEGWHEWTRDGSSKWSYVSDGKVIKGEVIEINGELYLFDSDGFMVTNSSTEYDGKSFIIDADGHFIEIQDGWNQIGEYTYYVIDGELVKDRILEIDGNYYGFDYNGRMFVNQSFSMNVYDESGSYLGYYGYRAGESGALLVNSWYERYGNRYYYGEGGRGAKGITNIDGQDYLFDDYGQLLINSAREIDDVIYLSDENGHPVRIDQQNGWVQVGSEWYYVENGDLVTGKVKKIGNSYYGFDHSGRMYVNQGFSMDAYDEKGTWLGYYGYRAGESGALYVNSWYQNNNDDWYYYGAEGKGAKGITKVNGKEYLFDDDGHMLVYGSRQIDGVTYIGDGNGYPVKVTKDNGWLAVGSAWFYIENKVVVRNKVKKIGTSYYGFDYQGKMYADREFEMYDSEGSSSYRWYYYRAKSSGALYANEWYHSENNDWYYYGSDAKRVSGLQKINGKTYVFAEYGRMLTNTTYSDGSKSYVIDGNGVATLLNNGWTKVGSDYYYTSGGNIYRNTVAKIGDAYYGFDYDGKMFDNTVFRVSGYSYRAKSGGALYVNSWVGNYYYGADGKGYIGEQTVNGVKYFFASDGEAVSNRYVFTGDKLYYTNAKCVPSEVTKDGVYRNIMNSNGVITPSGVCVSGGKILKNDWKKVDGKWYYFGSNGFYVTGTAFIGEDVYYFNNDGTMCGTGWQKTLNGDDIYVYAGGALATGKKTIDGKKYCFSENGYMVTGAYNNGDGFELYAKNGQLIGPVKTGWNEISGSWYYFDGTNAYQSGVYEINGAKYYFDYLFEMRSDCVFDNYIFGSSGAAVKSGWAQVGAYWYYVDSATGRCVYGRFMQIGGKKYKFDYSGRVQMNSFVYGNTAYTTDASGAITSEKSLKNGWELAGGNYYYYKDGNPYTGWVGNYYISSGRMLRNQIADGYWVGNDGTYNSRAGWVSTKYARYEYGSTLMYAKSGGKLVENGWEKIDGDWYYFSGYYAQTTPLKEGSTAYYFDVDGKLVKTVYDLTKDQWVNAGDYWGYIKNGEPVYSGKYMINGKEYNFGGGRMQHDTLRYYYDMYGEIVYYVQSDGTTASYNGWKKIHGSWYYFNLSNTAVVYGWISDNGKKYFIDGNGMVTGWRVVNDRLCNFGSDGAFVEEVRQQNGWLAKGGNWYYFVNGRPVTNEVKSISGKLYGFTSEGRLGNNELIYENGLCYADGNGIIVKNSWKKFGDVWYYFGANGFALDGVQRINGTVYYFRGYVLED